MALCHLYSLIKGEQDGIFEVNGLSHSLEFGLANRTFRFRRVLCCVSTQHNVGKYLKIRDKKGLRIRTLGNCGTLDTPSDIRIGCHLHNDKN